MTVTDRILRVEEVLHRTGLSRATLYRKIAAGTFPRQIALSTNCAGCHESAVSRWISDPPGYHC
ncbi:helix-turn-helix transcriptional regulator [Sphingobium sp.]|uniref:helix-turn-helix transcriptional regulator n=1 Tax=Sphingobium sp. TaxID=1912891 RepID=UPI002BA5BF68|nr:AlpA family phage regulatory protein [Sphingobium sp.]HUD94921.1 AlpA family phage regulatory protein [Sphingobium sp.]